MAGAWQVPLTQVSLPVHAVQVFPALPQAALAVPGRQSPSTLRQPLQVPPTQAPFWQVSPLAHAWQAMPEMPQAASFVGPPFASQTPLVVQVAHPGSRQKPVVQTSVELHTSHCTPKPQPSLAVPGLHSPAEVQQPLHEFRHCWRVFPPVPPSFGLTASGTQVPAWQMFAAGHGAHRLPAIPHC